MLRQMPLAFPRVPKQSPFGLVRASYKHLFTTHAGLTGSRDTKGKEVNSVVDCKNICRNKAPSYATVDGQNHAISLFMHATEGKGAGAWAGAGVGPATGAGCHAGPGARRNGAPRGRKTCRGSGDWSLSR